MIDPSTLPIDRLYAHFKSTAPVEDARFFLQHARGLTADEREQLGALIGYPLPRAQHYRALTAIQEAWRRRTTVRGPKVNLQALCRRGRALGITPTNSSTWPPTEAMLSGVIRR